MALLLGKFLITLKPLDIIKKMTYLRTTCFKCDKPLEFIVPRGGGDVDLKTYPIDSTTLKLAEGLEIHCSACKSVNRLKIVGYMLDTYQEV